MAPPLPRAAAVLRLTPTYLIVLVEDALQEEVGVVVELCGCVRGHLQPGRRETGAHNLLSFNLEMCGTPL